MAERYPVKAEVHVRFADVDSMGHVNNAVYLSYFEQARVAYFKKLQSLDLRFMDAQSAFGFIVAEIAVKFHSPAYLDEVMVVRLRTAEMRTKAFRFEYEIRDKKTRRLVATGYSVQVVYNYKKHASMPVPPSLRRKMSALEGRRL